MTNATYALDIMEPPATDDAPQEMTAAPVDNVVSISGQPITPPQAAIEQRPKRKYTKRKQNRKTRASKAAGAPTMEGALSQGAGPTFVENPTASPEAVGPLALSERNVIDHAARYMGTQFRPSRERVEYDTPRAPSFWARMVDNLMPGGTDGRGYVTRITDTTLLGLVAVAAAICGVIVLVVAIGRLAL